MRQYRRAIPDAENAPAAVVRRPVYSVEAATAAIAIGHVMSEAAASALVLIVDGPVFDAHTGDRTLQAATRGCHGATETFDNWGHNCKPHQLRCCTLAETEELQLRSNPHASVGDASVGVGEGEIRCS